MSLAIIDLDRVAIGDEVEIVWGESDGGSRKPRVERHRQLRIRATVAPAPSPAKLTTKKEAGTTAHS